MYLRSLKTIAMVLTTVARTTAQPCSQFSPAPVPIPQLPGYFPPHYSADATTLLEAEAIRQTLTIYPYIIDGRDFALLSTVFTTDAVANYSAPLGVLSGLSTIAATLEQSLAQFPGTQHLLGPQNVRVCDSDNAISVTYYRAVHFLPHNGTVAPVEVLGLDSVLYAYGQYQDTWEKRDGLWKIVYRKLVYMVGRSTLKLCRALTVNRARLSQVSIERWCSSLAVKIQYISTCREVAQHTANKNITYSCYAYYKPEHGPMVSSFVTFREALIKPDLSRQARMAQGLNSLGTMAV